MPRTSAVNGLKAPARTRRTTVKRRVPSRRPYAEVRTREYLTPREVDAVLRAARAAGRHGPRDHALILVGYRHGLRASELCGLEWSQVDMKGGTLAVRRIKGGTPSTHPLRGPVLRALRPLAAPGGLYVFANERGGPLTPSSVRRIVGRAGELAGLPFPVHPHMLRHGCGYALANAGHDTRAIAGYLGHRSLQSTMRYTELAPGRFKDFWRE